MLSQNGQSLNLQVKHHPKRSPERLDNTLPLTTKACDKLQTFDTSTGDLSQDLIKQLTLKNKLLNAQLSEYRTLVSTLNQRLQELQEENQRLQQIVGGQPTSTQKLHTIQQQLNSLSEITTKSRRRDAEQVKQEYFFHEISQMLNSYNLHSDSMSWQAYITTIETALQERKSLNHFASRISEMKHSMEPGGESLLDLWEWLKKVAWNYHCLLKYTHAKDKRHPKK